MTPEPNAFTALLSIAERGRPYRFDDVYAADSYSGALGQHSGLAPLNPARIIGNGHDFTTTVPVPDRTGGSTVRGRVNFRVLRLGESDVKCSRL